MKLPKIIWPGSKDAKEFAEFKQFMAKEAEFAKEKEANELMVNTGAEQNPEYLFDFLNWETSYGAYYQRGMRLDDSPLTDKEKVIQVRVKPVDVVESLYIPPQNFLDCSLIDEKIAMFQERMDLIHNNYSKEEIKGFIERLENRKKYADHREYFEGYQITTDEKIGELLDKHPELTRKASELFIPDFPKEAINRMKSYTNKVKEVTGKKPIYYVIAESDKFRKAYDKRDPILLAQSPFGFYWYILGAWDKEMLLLSEL